MLARADSRPLPTKSTTVGFESEPTQQELETPNPKARVTCRIERGVTFTPYEVVDWAKAQGLTIYYVDGSWVRVPASREAICASLAGRLEKSEAEQILRLSAQREEHWVIEAVEF